MPKSSVKTADRILDQGLQILSVTGLSGITFGSLASAVGMSKSGLFAHFRSKEDIQLRLMSRAEALIQAHVLAPAMTTPAGIARLNALMRGWLGWAGRAGLNGGCPIASALFELDDLEGEVRTYIRGVDARSHDLLAATVREAIVEGALRTDSNVDQIIWELRGIYLGHHVSSRFARDASADERAWTAYEALLLRYRA